MHEDHRPRTEASERLRQTWRHLEHSRTEASARLRQTWRDLHDEEWLARRAALSDEPVRTFFQAELGFRWLCRDLADPRWLAHRAATAPEPLRSLLLAELGFRAWWPAARGRVADSLTLTAPDGLPAGPGAPLLALPGLARHGARLAAADARRLAARAYAATQADYPTRGAGRDPATARLAHALGAIVAVLALLSASAFATVSAGRGRVPLQPPAIDGQAAALEAAAGDDGSDPVQPGSRRLATSATGAAATAAHAAAPATPVVVPVEALPTSVVPAKRGPIPVGKGMWIWKPEKAEHNDVNAMVSRAKAVGLTHIYVKTGDYRLGFIGADLLNRLLPVAHAAGIRVYAWDFPYLDDIAHDVNQALVAINYVTPDGHRVDGFVADIETKREKVNITPETGRAYGAMLRQAVGPDYPLVACVPRPSSRLTDYPFAEVVADFDAVAPMVYWMQDDPAAAVTEAMARLAPFGKPVIPVGQAYDGAPEGGPRGIPPREQLLAFQEAADRAGAVGVSWWSWQHADQPTWDAVRDAPQFVLPTTSPGMTPGQIRAYQALLRSLGFAAEPTGSWDAPTIAAVEAYQQAARLHVNGLVDEATRERLLTPFAPPLRAR